MIRYKVVTCGKCLSSLHIYEDTHPRSFRCPSCSTVQGVLWKKSDPVCEIGTNVPPYLAGEGAYDWSWLNYDKGESNVIKAG